MAQYNWEGTTRSGQVMKGVMEAPSEDAVKAQLRSQSIAPGKIKEAGKGLDMELVNDCVFIPGLSWIDGADDAPVFLMLHVVIGVTFFIGVPAVFATMQMSQ